MEKTDQNLQANGRRTNQPGGLITSETKDSFLDVKGSLLFLKENGKKLLLFLVISVLIAMIGHIVLPTPPYVANTDNHSEIALKLGFASAGGIYMVVTYLLLVLSAVLLVPFFKEDPKRSLLILAVLLSLLWFIGFFEAPSPEDTYLDLLILALNDSIPVFLLLWLTSKYSTFGPTTLPSIKKESNTGISRKSLFTIVVIAVVVVLVRLLGYTVFNMSSRLSDMPVPTMLWTIGIGLFCGIMYSAYRKVDRRGKSIHRILRFTLILFGINWTMYNLFIPLLMTESFLDYLIYRALFDICAIFVGSYCGDRIGERIEDSSVRVTV